LILQKMLEVDFDLIMHYMHAELESLV
jgi:hypothetical protein